MSKKSITVLLYHHHNLLGLIYNKVRLALKKVEDYVAHPIPQTPIHHSPLPLYEVKKIMPISHMKVGIRIS
jgi:hypothetical protein